LVISDIISPIFAHVVASISLEYFMDGAGGIAEADAAL
jgi:hypothetical protein